MENGITPVMNVGGDNGLGMNGFGGLFGLLVLLGILGGGGNSFFGNGNNSNAIQADVNRGFDNQNLQAQTRDILGAVTTGTAQTIAASTANATNAINAIKDGNAAMIREFGTVETAITALNGKQQECCCNILRAIDGVNFNAEKNAAAIREAILLDGQKTRDLFVNDRMAQMQNRINQLELANAMSGVVRYPMSSTYSSGANPFCSGSCAA